MKLKVWKLNILFELGNLVITQANHNFQWKWVHRGFCMYGDQKIDNMINEIKIKRRDHTCDDYFNSPWRCQARDGWWSWSNYLKNKTRQFFFPFFLLFFSFLLLPYVFLFGPTPIGPGTWTSLTCCYGPLSSILRFLIFFYFIQPNHIMGNRSFLELRVYQGVAGFLNRCIYNSRGPDFRPWMTYIALGCRWCKSWKGFEWLGDSIFFLGVSADWTVMGCDGLTRVRTDVASGDTDDWRGLGYWTTGGA